MSHSLAVLFPGQGSQSVGMLRGLADAYPTVQETFAEASEALGWDLWRLVSEGPKEDLDRTENTQPAMLAAGVAVWRTWLAQGGCAPHVLAGHSLGEYSALVAAGALQFRDAVRTVAERGRLMQGAVASGAGAMAAVIGLADAEVVALCAQEAGSEVLEAVNFNAPDQIVIAGEASAVERGVAAANAAGAKRAIVLPVSVPAHSSLMRPAAEKLAEELATVAIETPQWPVLHNVTAASESAPAGIRDLLVRQLFSPVRWVDTVGELTRSATLAIECGPGKVLTGLVRRFDQAPPTLPIYDAATLAAALERVHDA